MKLSIIVRASPDKTKNHFISLEAILDLIRPKPKRMNKANKIYYLYSQPIRVYDSYTPNAMQHMIHF
jgi:hypothetical protein